MSWIEDRISEYYSWLRDNTVIREDETSGWFAVSTPFVGQFNDNIEIFIKREGQDILLSDDGETLVNLSLSGVDISKSAKRKAYLNKILLNYGITLIDGELTTKSSSFDFAQRKHSLISAIMEIGDMDVLAKDNVTSLFYEDVKLYLDESGVLYTPDFIARGKSGLDFTFDFQIAGKESELVVRTFSSIKQNSVENFLFGLNDVRQVRTVTSGKKLSSLAIVNDMETIPNERLLEALKLYDTNVLLWSKKDKDTIIRFLTAA